MQRRFLAGLIIAGAAALWIPSLGSSLRLDETATHWVTSEGMRVTLDRASEFQGESPFYYLLMSAFRSVLGDSEIALRVPSLVAMALAAFLMFRLGKRLAGAEAGLLSCLVFVVAEEMAFAAGDARPYGLALLATVGATLALVRWMDGSRMDGALYVALAVIALYLHYFCGLALLSHPIFVLRRRPAWLRRYAIAAGVVGISMLGALPHLRSLFDRREHLEVSFAVSLGDLFAVLIPPVLVGASIVGLLLGRGRGRAQVEYAGRGGAWALALSWWILSPVILFAVSGLTETTLFEPRFLFFSVPGLALTAGLTLASFERDRMRRFAAAALVAASVFAFASSTHAADDWRTAAEAVRSVAAADTTVLVRPGFIESLQLDWFSSGSKLEYLSAPLHRYPMPGEILLIPYALDDATAAFVSARLAASLSGSDRFVLVNDIAGFEPWLRGRFQGWSVRTVHPGNVRVVLFSRGAG